MVPNPTRIALDARVSVTGPYTFEVPNYPETKGETVPRRSVKTSGGGLHSSPSQGVETLYDVLDYAATTYGDQNCVGTRKTLQTFNEVEEIFGYVNGSRKVQAKKVTCWVLGPYNYLSFKQFKTQTLELGFGLRKLGLQAQDRIHLYGPTSAHWTSMAHAASSQSMAIVTSYDSLGEEGLMHSLKQTRSKLIFVDPTLLQKLLGPLSVTGDTVHVIYDDNIDIDPESLHTFRKKLPHLRVMSIEDLRRLGEQNSTEVLKPGREDLACIMYTSGSTGLPKGVMIRHKNIVAGIGGSSPVFGYHLGPGDSFMAYLPSAHIFEFVLEQVCLYHGVTIGYGSAKTLTDTNVRNCKGDLRDLKPSLLIGVPLVYENIRKAIVDNVEKSGYIKSSLFWGALAAKSMMLSTGFPGETAEAFTSDGWFKTGDIGEFDDDGALKVIDRKKNLVKSLHGEYIALEKLESIYKTHKAVANICVQVRPNQAQPVAVIVLAETAAHSIASQHGTEVGPGLDSLVRSEKLRIILLQQLQVSGRKNGLKSFEILEDIILAGEEWTPHNGFCSAAQKLQRCKIANHYAEATPNGTSKTRTE